MKNLDNNIMIAFSVHSSPGVFALLLGSGISRSAGILTGWEVVLDLIRKIAVMNGESSLTDPEKWYKDKYEETPDYTKLLNKLTRTPAERANLLHEYFEPNEDDLDKGRKVPTQAHKSIAKLVKYGYIRMILTTNFDRLLEKAIEGEGITPVVVTDYSLEGAMPYVHNQCTILKLNGDYMDMRIKNTPEELAHYSEELDIYIDKIFDDFGLIVCGWSAEWDKALRDSLYRRKNRRFPTYWTLKGQPGDEAIRLINYLKAEKIQITGADEHFSKLLDNIEALRDFERPHPLSTDLAVAKVKKYLSEDKLVKLDDLVMDELKRVCSELSSERFETNLQSKPSPELYIKRVHEYEILMKTLVNISATLVYFDNKKCSTLIKRTIERILQTQKYSGNSHLIDLQRYPVLLLFNNIGVVSLESNNYNILASILLKPRYYGYWSRDYNDDEKSTLIEELYFTEILKSYEKTEIENTNRYIADIVHQNVNEYLPQDRYFEKTFDTFEYLLGIIFIDLKYKNLSKDKILVPFSRLGLKYYSKLSREKPKFIHEFIQEGKNEKNEWSLLKAGFFNSSIERFDECYHACEQHFKDTYKDKMR